MSDHLSYSYGTLVIECESQNSGRYGERLKSTLPSAFILCFSTENISTPRFLRRGGLKAAESGTRMEDRRLKSRYEG